MSDFTTHYITAQRAKTALLLSQEEMQGMLFGVEGPDYLFYASIFAKSAETTFGYSFHKFVPKYFFEKCVQDLKETSNANYKIKRGYILGMLLHYFGDMTIHPYINWLEEHKNSENFRFIHMQNEAEIDLLLYEMEYGKSINNFNPSKEMKFDKNLQQVIFEVWQNQDMQVISKEVIKKGCKRLVLSGNIFNQNRFKWLLKLAEPKSVKGFFMCHYKDDINPAVMNMEKNPWTCEGETFNMSIPDIVDATLEKFLAEVEKIEDFLKNGGSYSFDHTVNFDGRTVEKFA